MLARASPRVVVVVVVVVASSSPPPPPPMVISTCDQGKLAVEKGEPSLQNCGAIRVHHLCERETIGGALVSAFPSREIEALRLAIGKTEEGELKLEPNCFVAPGERPRPW